MCILLASTAGNLAAIALTAARRGSQETESSPPSVASASWHYGWPLSLWLGVSTITLYADRFILEHSVSQSELGRYTATADLIVRGFAMLATPILLSVHPVFMREHNFGQVAQAARVLSHWTIRLVLLMTISVLAAAALGPWILRLVLDAPGPGRATVVALSLAAAFSQLALLSHKPLEVRHRTRAMLGFAIAGLLVEVAISSVLVPSQGSLGVATGLLAGNASYVALVEQSVRRELRRRRNTRSTSEAPWAP
jgi:O-antigen/teichoic acid export membrane protein